MIWDAIALIVMLNVGHFIQVLNWESTTQREPMEYYSIIENMHITSIYPTIRRPDGYCRDFKRSSVYPNGITSLIVKGHLKICAWNLVVQSAMRQIAI